VIVYKLFLNMTHR